MNKMVFYIITVSVIISLGAICLVFAGDEACDNIPFIESYGWQVEQNIHEKEKVKIPEEFDDVYNNYNNLQKLSGLDLTDYKGRNAIRYTYIVKNFPKNCRDTVYINVLCVDSKPVAGDVMTVQLDGFMYSLNYLNIGK